jgi:hypothetical protein
VKQFIDRETGRNDAAAEIDSNNSIAALTAHRWQDPAQAINGEGMHRDDPLMRYSRDRDIDQPADDDRDHLHESQPWAQMQFAQADS